MRRTGGARELRLFSSKWDRLFVVLATVLATTLIGPLASAAPVRPVVDGDGDGVDDTIDQCLYSPPNAVVDAHGCSQSGDQDGDGVTDDLDDCPYTPPGAQVDARGCAVDADFDGVADGLDRCPGSELGATVDASGCATGQVAGAAATVRRPAATPIKPAAAVIEQAPVPVIAEQTVVPAVGEAASVMPPAVISAPVPATISASETIGAVRFGRSSSFIGGSQSQDLKLLLPAIRKALAGQPNARVVVQGYAEAGSEGSGADTLARSRANQVRRLLEAEGIDTRRLASVGLPAAQPVPGAAEGSLRKAEIVIESE